MCMHGCISMYYIYICIRIYIYTVCIYIYIYIIHVPNLQLFELITVWKLFTDVP